MMFEGNKILSIIPARGGSKRIPKKNIIKIAGKELIGYSIEQSLNSKYIDETYISSDDNEILTISKKFGANIIKRPEEIAQNNSKTVDVLKHAIEHLKEKNMVPDIVVLLQPTSPLRKTEQIDKAIELFVHKNADSVFGVTKRHIGPQWIFKRDGDKIDFLLHNDLSVSRSQDEKETFELNGAIYVYSKDVIEKSKDYAIGKNTYPLVMDEIDSIQIDIQSDLKLAEYFLQKRKNE